MHQSEPCFDLVLKVPLTSDVLLRRKKARSRSSDGREAGGRAAGTDRQPYSAQRGCWIQGGRWDKNAPSLQSGVTSEEESCLPLPPTAFSASDVTKRCSERNVLPRQWKENEQWQKLKRNAGTVSEKSSPPNHSQAPAAKRWLSAHTHPSRNPGEGCGDIAAGAKYQPQLHAPIWNHQILAGGAFSDMSTQGNSSAKGCVSLDWRASWRAGSPTETGTPHRSGTQRDARKKCFALNTRLTYPGSGSCPHLTLTFMNLSWGKTEMLWLCWVFISWRLVCVSLKKNTNCY